MTTLTVVTSNNKGAKVLIKSFSQVFNKKCVDLTRPKQKSLQRLYYLITTGLTTDYRSNHQLANIFKYMIFTYPACKDRIHSI